MCNDLFLSGLELLETNDVDGVVEDGHRGGLNGLCVVFDDYEAR